MGIWDAISEIFEVVTPWSVVEAEAPAEPPQEQAADTESKDEEATEESTEEATEDAEKEDEDEEEDDEDEDEDEDDEEEIVDPKETLEEECKNSAQCAPAKHHFDECVERVHQQQSEGEAKEDCVEECVLPCIMGAAVGSGGAAAPSTQSRKMPPRRDDADVAGCGPGEGASVGGIEQHGDESGLGVVPDARSPVVVAAAYRTYRRRWFGLTALTLMNVVVSWDWLTFAPVADISALYYGVSTTAINWLSTAFFLAFVAVFPVTIATLHRGGPRPALMTAAVLIVAGNWIR
ncbi:hypothetical protein E4U41_006661, partial [Claviceps citrina]